MGIRSRQFHTSVTHFNSMLVLGCSPDSVSSDHDPCTKGQETACTSDNFRAITLSNIVAKLFDVIILSKEQYALASSHL